ncbi:MAG TPA: OmpA family protein [Thioalkalivibrio sp.]|nr:OmpA family protein [Thioalkalivibrio sp.]
MNTISKLTATALGCVMVASLTVTAHAHSGVEDVKGTAGYILDARGNVVRNGPGGDCWRSSQWSKDLAIKACDPDLFPERAEAPPPAAPAPRPAPTPPPAPRMVEETRTLDAGALFAINSTEISDRGRSDLDQLVRDLGNLDSVDSINVVGHTDSTGTASYNMDLSERRAESVKAYMVSKGVDPQRITTSGMGLTQPVASNDTREGRTQNRRVEITIRGSDMVRQQQ